MKPSAVQFAWFACWFAAVALQAAGATAGDESSMLQLHLRTRAEVAPGSDRYREVTREVEWDPRQTAIVICDMWNDHYCRNAARRVAEMAPRMNEVIKSARKKGVLIIHAPSGCMDQYEGTAQRRLAQQAPPVETSIPLQGWCYLDEKHEAPMPVAVDQPCDDDGAIRDRVRFFDRQIDILEIAEGDAITDSAEAFYLMKQRGITNVILMGVHTNMCVLGRPFGIRQLVYQGQNVALMRDMTDSMYNPRDEPFVNHFTGNDLIFEHIERHWCPTVTSADFLGDQPYRFPGDKRKHLVVVMAEDEYETARTLPPFALRHLGGDFKVSFVFASNEDRNDIPGIELLNDADVAVWSIRRRTLPAYQLEVVRDYLAAGKPLVALRTTSHAFCLREGVPAEGLSEWPEFDRDVLGGNYRGHHGNQLKAYVQIAEGAASHPLLTDVGGTEFRVFGSLYKSSPLAPTAAPLMYGRAEELQPKEPVVWTHQRPGGGKVFYTSLGHPGDFELQDFQNLLRNAVYWAADLPVRRPPVLASSSGRDPC